MLVPIAVLVGRVNSLQVLVEGVSKTAPGCMTGRSDGFQSIRIPAKATFDKACGHTAAVWTRVPKPGDYVAVHVTEQDGRLSGAPLEITTMSKFGRDHQSDLGNFGVFPQDPRYSAVPSR